MSEHWATMVDKYPVKLINGKTIDDVSRKSEIVFGVVRIKAESYIVKVGTDYV